MELTTPNLDALRLGFKTSFQGAFDKVPTMRDKVAEVVPSTTSENLYGWLGELPGMREWLGERVVRNLEEHDYRVKNRDWEETLGVNRNHIKDDTVGQYSKRFELMGRSAARHPELLVWEALKAGFTDECYDGQPFFDTDHPVLDEDGEETTVANTDGGAGNPWFLLCTNEVVMPILLQVREAAQFVALDQPTDRDVFLNKLFLYGSEWRGAVAYAFWQMAWGSKQDLDADTYKLARQSLTSMRSDYGHPMGLMPNLLVVGPSNEAAGRELLNSERNAAGATNVWKDTAELLVCPWLD
ncbi:Mu-like prophage major head subunit gpT family protein [Pseudoruegeria sp. HB172150]|uniref:Mu-like prophage major head subunit gpT family protein n=1 Tax=Pseudoruegeria sp. HB172150 TaxID=2721164 RepID=UPI001552D33D|nr:Mu-like prophage major head subunit gpT family protein [Pseudoruegeria sp. HB172150]